MSAFELADLGRIALVACLALLGEAFIALRVVLGIQISFYVFGWIHLVALSLLLAGGAIGFGDGVERRRTAALRAELDALDEEEASHDADRDRRGRDDGARHGGAADRRRP